MADAQTALAPSPASSSGSSYERHRPEDTVLYQTLQTHWRMFLAEAATGESGPELPRFVMEEVEAFLKCGILAHGFLRVVCDGCHENRLVAFSATAVLTGGVDSPASDVMTARTFDGSPPPEPTWERSDWVKLDSGGVEHPFTDTDPALKPAIVVRISFASTTVVRVLIHLLSGNSSQTVSAWLDPLPGGGAGTRVFATYLQNLTPTKVRRLRSRAVTQGGQEGLSAAREIPVP